MVGKKTLNAAEVRWYACDRASGYQQRTVAIAQETEVVLESVIVDFVPIAMEEGTHKKEQRGLWLVEIGYQHLHYLVLKAWGYDNLRTRMECL